MVALPAVARENQHHAASPADLADLVRADHARCVALAYHLVGDPDAARDVVQNAFVRALGSLHQFRGASSLRTWLVRIVLREAARYRRWRGVRERFQQLVGVRRTSLAAPDGPLAAAEGAELRAHIAAALSSLSPNQREAFALVHLQSYSVAEAAAVLGKAPGTVKTHVHRAIQHLRVALGPHWKEDDHG